jgi:hypothetical protein
LEAGDSPIADLVVQPSRLRGTLMNKILLIAVAGLSLAVGAAFAD